LVGSFCGFSLFVHISICAQIDIERSLPIPMQTDKYRSYPLYFP
jgi:hypothetical protein